MTMNDVINNSMPEQGNELTNVEKAWLQLEQLQQNFETLSNEELIEVRIDCLTRISDAMELLSPQVRDDMSEYEI
ncbi:hypothetical protein [Alkaliphilus sp. B6464]|uniref:hypothetical protein n=1 Tax=Alkaliphilus sp. B6464 TaxID=2731219 RepID=UPI001BAD2B74|nr:hypothetical protein [Alkaliphilus sp. B6464]QUH22222.1 hypothetical protein HYG84_20150 [Alkaliphilus sp. B6464]